MASRGIPSPITSEKILTALRLFIIRSLLPYVYNTILDAGRLFVKEEPPVAVDRAFA